MQATTTKPRSKRFRLALAAAALGWAGWSGAQTATPSELAGPRLDIQRYAVDEGAPLSEQEMRTLLAPFVGPGKTMRDIEGAAGALERTLRDRGYAFHRIFIPEQKPVDGVIRLGVLQIRVGSVEVTGNTHFSAENIRRSLPGLKEGEIPQVQLLGRDVTASNANPSKQTTVTFKESATPNAVDAAIRVKDVDPVTYFASLSLNEPVSQGSSASRTRRISGGFQHANLFDLDHVMTVSYTTDPGYPSDVSLVGVYYQFPIYGTGMNFSAAFTHSDVNSGQVLQGPNVFDVSGSGRFLSLRLTRALNRVGSLQQTIGVGLDERYFKNSTTFNGAQIQPNVGSRVLSLQYTVRDEPQWGVVAAGLDFATNVGGGTSNSSANHVANGGTKSWKALRYHVEAATLAGDWQISGRLKGQLSDDALISGEQFGLGGATSLRGFADRVTSGDRGHQWNIEGLGPAIGDFKLRPLVFLEGGRVSVKGGASDTLMSIGAGIRMSLDKWQMALDLAKVLDRNSAETRSSPVRLHFAASYRF